MGYLSKILYPIIQFIPVYMVYLFRKKAAMVEKYQTVLQKRQLLSPYIYGDASVSAMVIRTSYEMLIRFSDSLKSSFWEVAKAFSEKFLGKLGILFHVPFHVVPYLLQVMPDGLTPSREEEGDQLLPYQKKRGTARRGYEGLLLSATMG
jgi:hypothetical protein